MPDKELQADPAERDFWTVAIGIALFALAIAIITIGTSAITGN